MATNVSIAQVARRAVSDDRKSRKLVTGQDSAITKDSFINFAQKFGVGADNALSTASYGYNPITRNRVLLEWMHRGSWLAGVAVDVVANDMTRGGIELKGKINPRGMEQIEEATNSLKIWQNVNDLVRWDRLYGGAIAVFLIDGQALNTPLRIETIAKGGFKGLTVLDRWMVQPTLNMLVTDYGPELGQPKFYDVVSDSPALRGARIHYSRVIRLDGVRMPYWQRLTENLWGTSVLERLYDRMIAFDSATTGAAQLVYKAYIRTYKIKGLRELVAAGGPALAGVGAYVEFMRRFQGQEGVTLMDADDEFEGVEAGSAFSGLSDALTQFAQQLAGALQIPLVRLFGMSPAGFSTGDTDLQMYYDTVRQQQTDSLLVPMTRVMRCIAQSEGVKLPDGFAVEFRSLWQMDEKEKADIVTAITSAVVQANEAGLVSDQVAMKELRQSSHNTGVFSNITDKDITSADDVAEPPPDAEDLLHTQASLSESEGLPGAKKKLADKPDKPLDKVKAKEAEDSKRKKVKDSIKAATDMKWFHDLDVAIENPRGTLRNGKDWIAAMPADYGYFLGTVGHDGDNVDCYVGKNHESKHVWVLDVLDPVQGVFDENKVLLGYNTLADALTDFTTGYTDGKVWDRIGSISMLTMDQFKTWLSQYKRPANLP